MTKRLFELVALKDEMIVKKYNIVFLGNALNYLYFKVVSVDRSNI